MRERTRKGIAKIIMVITLIECVISGNTYVRGEILEDRGVYESEAYEESENYEESEEIAEESVGETEAEWR